MKSSVGSKTSRDVPLYRLKITLRRSKPPIWRRVVVPAEIRLDDLHTVIQTVMGWSDSHLHQFMTGGGFGGRTCYGVPDPEFNELELLDERRFTLADLAPLAKRTFTYEYDFGDSWEHEVKVERIFPPEPSLAHPFCLDGEMACPPEDCGGIFGYYELLEALADPKHSEHDRAKEWIGDGFDPAKFDANAVNAQLERLRIPMSPRRRKEPGA